MAILTANNLTFEMRQRTIAIDVDGVLADYTQGWRGEHLIGDPLPGAAEFLQELRDTGWKIVIFSARSADYVTRWMLRHGLVFDEVNRNSDLENSNPGKPVATVYLDDRGIRFNGDFKQAFKEIENFKVWYEAG